MWIIIALECGLEYDIALGELTNTYSFSQYVANGHHVHHITGYRLVVMF